MFLMITDNSTVWLYYIYAFLKHFSVPGQETTVSIEIAGGLLGASQLE